MKKIAISEVFYSIQGEGKTVGIPSVFIRLGGCNLMCGGMGTQFDGELHNEEWRCDTVAGLELLIKHIKENINPNAYFEVETNGTIMPNEFLLNQIHLWNCSPKLRNSGNDRSMTFKSEVIKELNTKNTIFKFVVNNTPQWEEIKELYLSIVDRSKVYLMPAGENQELLNENKINVVEIAKNNYLNFTTRLHIDIWNKKTGV